MSKTVHFAIHAQADIYLAACNANNPDPTPGAPWYCNDRFDAQGRRVVAFLGPGGGWNKGDCAEPPACAIARTGGVILDGFTWADPQ